MAVVGAAITELDGADGFWNVVAHICPIWFPHYVRRRIARWMANHYGEGVLFRWKGQNYKATSKKGDYVKTGESIPGVN